MSAPSLLIELRAGGHRYFAPHDQVASLTMFDPGAPPAHDERGVPLVARSLAELLGPPTLGQARQALIVRLRRRAVALLVERVERLADDLPVQQLPTLLRRRLTAPWVLGVVAADEAPILVLDLRRIAADVALGAA